MSFGAGKIERAIAGIFEADSSASYDIEEIACRVYQVRFVKKKHRVAVLRAAKNAITYSCPEWEIYKERHHNKVFFANAFNFISWAETKRKAQNRHKLSESDLADCQSDVDLKIAIRSGDNEKAERIKAQTELRRSDRQKEWQKLKTALLTRTIQTALTMICQSANQRQESNDVRL